MMFFTAHGGASGEGRLTTNGLTVAAPFGGGGVSDVTYDTANAEEMQVLISGGLGESETGGPMINIVPKSGGNQFRGAAFFSTAGDWATSNNVDDQLRSYGITQPPTLRKNWDLSGSLGGPVKKDKLCSSPTCADGPTPGGERINANRLVWRWDTDYPPT
jgi:hypothetical protein